MRVAFVNDTSDWYHWGCTATSQAIRDHLGQLAETVRSLPIRRTYQIEAPDDVGAFFDAPVSQKFERANPDVMALFTEVDTIVVNGEGTLHGVRRASWNLIYLMLVAKRDLGKRVFVINHSMYPYSLSASVSPFRRLGEKVAACALRPLVPNIEKRLHYEIYRRVYNRIDGAAFRDTASFDIARKLRFRSRLAQSFDCLPLSISDAVYAALARQQADRRILLAARGDMPETFIDAMAKIARRLRESGFDLEVISGAKAAECKDEALLHAGLAQRGVEVPRYAATSLDDWLMRIGSSAALVSGRFHHTIAAHMMGVPVVLLDAMTPKTQSVSQMLGLPQPRHHSHYLDDRNAGRVLSDIEHCPTITTARRQEIVAAAKENFRLISS